MAFTMCSNQTLSQAALEDFMTHQGRVPTFEHLIQRSQHAQHPLQAFHISHTESCA